MSLESQLLDMLPGMAPPPGVTSDFVHPYSLQGYNTITITICMTISTLFVAMRMYTNARITNTLNWEDYTCFVAWLGLVAFAAMNLPLRANGDGVHQWNVPLSHLIRWAQLANIAEVLICVVTLLTRASIILLYGRIFAPNRSTRLYYVTWFMFYITIVGTLVFMFTFIFECIPRSKLWDPNLPGHCLDPFAIYYSSGIYNILADAILFILPQYSIWTLQMPLGRKVKFSAAFAMALLAPVASIFRLVASIQNGKSADQTYSTFTIGMWTFAEMTTGIVVSCFPAFSAFITFMRTTYPTVSSKLSSLRSPTSAPARIGPFSAASSAGPVLSDAENQSGGTYYELGSITYHEGLVKDPTVNAEHVLANGGIRKTMRVESVEDFSGTTKETGRPTGL